MDVNVLFDLVSREINKEKMVQNVKEIGKTLEIYYIDERYVD